MVSSAKAVWPRKAASAPAHARIRGRRAVFMIELRLLSSSAGRPTYRNSHSTEAHPGAANALHLRPELVCTQIVRRAPHLVKPRLAATCPTRWQGYSTPRGKAPAIADVSVSAATT